MAVITFRYSEARDRFLKFNTKSTMQKLFSCCRNEDEFIIEDQNEKPIDLKIRGAPEPEDIKWQNLGISTCEKIVRKLVIYFITLLILSTSFGVVYFLSKAQLQNSWTTAISLIISFFLGGLNLLIGSTVIVYHSYHLQSHLPGKRLFRNRSSNQSSYQVNLCSTAQLHRCADNRGLLVEG